MARALKTLAPRVGVVRLSGLVAGDVAALAAHDTFAGLRFEGVDLSGSDLEGASFEECAFVDVVASELGLRSAELADTVIERLNVPVVSAPRSRWRDISIDQSRVGSVELYEATVRSVHVSNSKLGYVNLRGADCADVLFSNCTIDELDLGGAKASRVAFETSSVGTLDTTRATLSNVDLRGLELRNLIGLDDLRGAIMSQLQVADLARLLAERIGIVIED